MIESIKNLFRSTPEAKYSELLKEGAVIVDVRSTAEYKGGHIRGSINIPVDELSSQLHRFPDKKKVIITCCASGMRSGRAASMLQGRGYERVYNGGGWAQLKAKL